MKKEFKILSLNISQEKGVPKTPIQQFEIKPDFGIVNDAHAGNWHRQISLLAQEDIDTLKVKCPTIKFGDFAENITTQDINLPTLPIGTKLYIDETIMEVTQIGKECHTGCAIAQITGECVMPKRGIFAKVLKGGVINRESYCYYDI